MAKHRIFLDEPCEGEVGKGTMYRYEDGVLELEWYGQSALYYFPRKSAVLIKCEGVMPEAHPLRYPDNFRWRALWLCGVNRGRRCSTCAEFDARVENDHPTRIAEGSGWKLAWKETEGREWIAFGWISGRVTNADVMAMIQASGVNVPRWFIREVLGV